MKKQTRRRFFRTAGVGLAGMATLNGFWKTRGNATAQETGDVEIGIASDVLRNLSVDEVIAAMNDLQLSKITVSDVHLPYSLSPADAERTILKMYAAGLHPYAAGVIYMPTIEEIAKAFMYAKVGRFGMIIGVPDHKHLDLAEQTSGWTVALEPSPGTQEEQTSCPGQGGWP